ncbi:MAG: adenosylmethionine--8-amino-7-oxononanoate transaminase [Polyangiales bacterium]
MSRLREIDQRHLWRPYTSRDEHTSREFPNIVGGSGPWLFCDDGRRLLDATGSWWCNNLGYQHPRLVSAIQDQASTLLHCSYADAMHEQAVLLAGELVDCAPTGLTRVFYSDDGSTSVEVAVKIAFQYWQQAARPKKQRFVVLPNAYHGDTIGTMSLGGVDEFNAVFSPLHFASMRAPAPSNGDWEPTFSWIEKTLRQNGDEIAAVVVEPLVQGANQMQMYDAAYLARLRHATEANDVLLIFDEVFTGFGRTGKMWAANRGEVSPDLLCTSKGLTGGSLPFAATLATDRVYAGFDGDKTRALMHGHTFYGNPLGARAAREVLSIFRDEDIVQHIEPRAKRIAESFEKIGEISGVLCPRSLGMIGAVDVGRRGYNEMLGHKVSDVAIKHNLLLRPLGNTVYVVPPLNIPMVDLEKMLRIAHDAIDEVMKEHG